MLIQEEGGGGETEPFPTKAQTLGGGGGGVIVGSFGAHLGRHDADSLQ